jgi:hypothetical protein
MRSGCLSDSEFGEQILRYEFSETTAPATAIMFLTPANIYQFSSGSQSPNSSDELAKALSDLLSPKGANAVESEAEQHALFLAHAHIVSVVLHGHRTTVPTIAGGDR